MGKGKSVTPHEKSNKHSLKTRSSSSARGKHTEGAPTKPGDAAKSIVNKSLDEGNGHAHVKPTIVQDVTREGLKAFAHLLEQLQSDPGATLVLTHRLEPEQQQKLTELLSRDPDAQATAIRTLQEDLANIHKELNHRTEEMNKLHDELANILNSIHLPLIVVGKDLKVKRVSPAAQQILQVRQQDIGRKITNVKLLFDIPDLAAMIAEVVTRVGMVARAVVDANGHWFSLIVRTYRTHEHQIEGAVLTFVDIDEYKRNEVAFRAHQIRERQYLDVAQGILMTLDPQLNVKSINKSGREILGYDEADILGKNWVDMFVPKTCVHEVRALWNGLVVGEGKEPFEHPIVTRGGEERTISWRSTPVREPSGAVIGLICSGEDLTMLRQINTALQKSEERFHLMMESVREDEFFIMDNDGYIVSWIARPEEGMSYKAEETVGQHFSSFYSPEDFQSGKPMRILEIAAREGRYEEDGWRMRKDGSRMRAYIIVMAIKDQSHNLLGYSNATRYMRERSEASEKPLIQIPDNLIAAP